MVEGKGKVKMAEGGLGGATMNTITHNLKKTFTWDIQFLNFYWVKSSNAFLLGPMLFINQKNKLKHFLMHAMA